MDRIPLSSSQQFVCAFDRGNEEGPFGPRAHIVHGWRLRGEIDEEVLRAALGDVVVRHEALRTQIVRDDGPSYQRVLPPGPVTLEVRDLSDVDPARRDDIADALITEVESGTISSQRFPLIRGLLGSFGARDHILVLIVHHLAADGWSVRLIIRDFTRFYARRRGFDLGALPPMLAYRDYARREQAGSADPVAQRSRAYWRQALHTAKIFAVPTDHPKSAGLPESTAIHRFLIEEKLVTAVLEIAAARRSTPFMVLLAAFMRLAHRITGETDLVVPTFTSGRRDEDVQDTVGMFINMLPIRVQLAGCRDFGELADRVRDSCVEAYQHDVSRILDEAPQLMEPVLTDTGAGCVFQVFPFPYLLSGDLIGDVEYTEVRRRLRSQPVGGEVPNGQLWTLNFDAAGDMVGAIQYNTNLFGEATITSMVSDYLDLLRSSVLAREAALDW